LTINVAPGAAGSRAWSASTPSKTTPPNGRLAWLTSTGAFVFASFCAGGLTRRRRWIVMCGLVLFAALLFTTSCGGGGQQTIKPAPPPPATAPSTTYYTVLVTGTANGVVHNSQIIVAVQ